jgi:AraC-like DNA-binding protein
MPAAAVSQRLKFAFRAGVGYGSPSQFSREYGRFFGIAPTKDINRLREEGLKAGEALR